MSEQNAPPWQIHRVTETRSTNDLARTLGPWNVVIAECQTDGRGRHGRSFSSAPGGLWLSAVLPIPGGPNRWTGLALAVGWGILQWLDTLPVPGCRLRWPNDLMVHDKKLGGILLEQNQAESCIAGVGINIHNLPGQTDPSLLSTTTRLADLLSDCPSASALAPCVLQGIRNGHQRMAESGLPGMMQDLNVSWGGNRTVLVQPVDGEEIEGRFLGIDEAGALVLQLPGGGGRIFPAHMVQRMVEL